MLASRIGILMMEGDGSLHFVSADCMGCGAQCSGILFCSSRVHSTVQIGIKWAFDIHVFGSVRACECACVSVRVLSHVFYMSKEVPSQFFPPSGRGRRKLLVSPLVYPDPEPYARTVAQMTAHLGQEQTVNP